MADDVSSNEKQVTSRVFEIETGKLHTFEAEVAAATVVGDFGQQGSFTEHILPIQARRMLRPGAILATLINS
jgi:hypothetical protein